MFAFLNRVFSRRRPLARPISKSVVLSGHNYAELHRIRERILDTLQRQNQKTVLVVSPHEDAGNTLLVSLLGFNTASFTDIKVVLVDLNMRRPQLHIPFGLKIERGFTEFAAGSLKLKESLKSSNLSGLQIMTAGRHVEDLHRYLNPALLEGLIRDMQQDFDLIIFDSSPVLIRNRNNVDPVLLSTICDMVLMLAQDKKTPKARLRDAIAAISDGGGTVSGIVYNKQFEKGLAALIRGK
ncbi:MAG: CpsD/CapB family tyrosine-protein kinase [Thermodesulfobacteriota bacterium]|nr:CpsD/CapB family tyrosine-protein kinase [Thermodesulfobacteriota bacterium]